MKSENRSELLHDAIEFIDDDMLFEVDRLRTDKPKVKRKILYTKWAALAASVCVLIGGSFIYKDYIQPHDTEVGSGVGDERDNLGKNTERTDGDIVDEEKEVQNIMQEGLFGNSEGMVDSSENDGFYEHEVDSTVAENTWVDVIQQIVGRINHVKDSLKGVD